MGSCREEPGGTSPRSQEAVGRGLDAGGTAVQDMGVDHRRGDVLVAGRHRTYGVGSETPLGQPIQPERAREGLADLCRSRELPARPAHAWSRSARRRRLNGRRPREVSIVRPMRCWLLLAFSALGVASDARAARIYHVDFDRDTVGLPPARDLGPFPRTGPTASFGSVAVVAFRRATSGTSLYGSRSASIWKWPAARSWPMAGWCSTRRSTGAERIWSPSPSG